MVVCTPLGPARARWKMETRLRSSDAESMSAYLGGSGSGPVGDRKLNDTEDMSLIVANTLFRWVRLGPGGRCTVITRSIESESGYESSLGPASARRWIHTDNMRKIKSLWLCVPRWVRLGPGGRWKQDCEAVTQNLCLHTSVGPARAWRGIGN